LESEANLQPNKKPDLKMAIKNEKDPNRVKKVLGWYNIIPNLIWSILNLTPISIYLFNLPEHKTFYIFLAASLIPLFFKKSFVDKLQIGKTVRFYERFGVHLVNHFTQNGVMINKLVKRKFPGHKIVSNRKSSISALINQTYLFERFHLIFFLFFSFTIVYAFSKGQLKWACIILLANIVYNIYPNLLQQYIRLKLRRFNKDASNPV
jgi:hypothetical protein